MQSCHWWQQWTKLPLVPTHRSTPSYGPLMTIWLDQSFGKSLHTFCHVVSWPFFPSHFYHYFSFCSSKLVSAFALYVTLFRFSSNLVATRLQEITIPSRDANFFTSPSFIPGPQSPQIVFISPQLQRPTTLLFLKSAIKLNPAWSLATHIFFTVCLLLWGFNSFYCKSPCVLKSSVCFYSSDKWTHGLIWFLYTVNWPASVYMEKGVIAETTGAYYDKTERWQLKGFEGASGVFLLQRTACESFYPQYRNISPKPRGFFFRELFGHIV